MGYDCTLHLIDVAAIAGEFVPRLFGAELDTALDQYLEEPEQFWESSRHQILEEAPDNSTRRLGMLALMYSAAQLPHLEQRNVALSLLDSWGLDSFPKDLTGSPEALFEDAVAWRQELGGMFHQAFEGNYSTGVYVPADRVVEAAAWLQQQLQTLEPGDRQHLAGLLRVLQTAAREGLAYWEATELWEVVTGGHAVHARQELLDSTEGLLPGAQRWELPDDAATGFWRAGCWLVMGSLNFHITTTVDLSCWPPAIEALELDCVRSAVVLPGDDDRWAVVSRRWDDDEEVLFPLTVCSGGLGGQATEVEAAISHQPRLERVMTLGGQLYAVSSAEMFADDAPRLLRLRQGMLAAAREVPPALGLDYELGREHTIDKVTLGNGGELLIWDGDGYELQDGQLEKTWALGLESGGLPLCPVPRGDDGFYYLADGRLFGVRRQGWPEPMMTDADNVQQLCAGPGGTLLAYLGDNEQGHTARLVWPDEGKYVPLRLADLSSRAEDNVRAAFYSELTRRFYFIAKCGLLTVPEASVLAQDRHPFG